MNMIVAVTGNMGIGYKNDLLVNIPEDKRYFRTLTKGKVVVMGRKTLESLPGGRPLKNRVNIVLSTTLDKRTEGITVVSNLARLEEALKAYSSEDVFVIGGQRIYETLLPKTNVIYITRVTCKDPLKCDRFFPDIDSMSGWQKTWAAEAREWENGSFRFEKYERISSM